MDQILHELHALRGQVQALQQAKDGASGHQPAPSTTDNEVEMEEDDDGEEFDDFEGEGDHAAYNVSWQSVFPSNKLTSLSPWAPSCDMLKDPLICKI